MNREELAICLEAGFIDYNIDKDERFLPKILTNNSEKKVKVLETLLYQMKNCDEFFFSVAFVTNSGVACMIDILNELKERNIKGKILASQYQNFTEPRALRRLLQFPNLELKIITADYNFHAKGYLFHKVADEEKQTEDSYNLIIGSSNLTQTALTVNREWNVQLSSLENGALVKQMQEELEKAWDDATVVDDDWIDSYEAIYKEARSSRIGQRNRIIDLYKINPNKMQAEALKSLKELREEGKDKALLISATGTGKTFLSAFDVKIARPKRFLFIVHRNLIARTAKESYEKIIDKDIKTGIFSGSRKEIDQDYLFSTIQTLCKDENLHMFAPDHFDYIVVDEVHRAGAKTYQKVLDYFKPKFLLGMTATPERTDDGDIFKMFDYNIAYEIRLNQALSENMLVPFHYHGISELMVDGKVIDELSDFRLLVSEERVKHILKYADFYGCDEGRVKGLVFCSKIDEAKALAEKFCEYGKKAIALTGASSEEERSKAIERLESDELPVNEQIDYIFTVDIFNEGIDIPCINQIILLRPTESAIIFVQQLGRGLRKSQGKRYLEVIDFIGNYGNNYLLPIALFGNRSYNKEKVRREMHNNHIPGASTVYFDDVSQKRIFEALNNGKIAQFREYKKSYELVKMQLGRVPMMMDFVRLGDKDPYLFVLKDGSYFHFKQHVDLAESTMNDLHQRLLKFIGLEVANGKRLEEVFILKELLHKSSISFLDVISDMLQKYDLEVNVKSIIGAINVLKMGFFKIADVNKYGNIELVSENQGNISLTKEFSALLENEEFLVYFKDALDYAEYSFMETYDKKTYFGGLKLYENYSRKDVCRILNWEKDESATVYGYRVKYNTCPMFVTYNKQDDISESTKYEDRFISRSMFSWMTRNRVTLESAEVEAIQRDDVRKLLFVKKSDGEGTDFYYMGDVDTHKCIQTTIDGKDGKKLSIVNVLYDMQQVVNDKIYSYFEDEQ